MGDEKRLLVSAISVLVIAALLYAVGVVVLTRSELSLSGGGPLGKEKAIPEEECGDLTRSASQALADGRLDEALFALSLVESLSCDDVFLSRAAQIYSELERPNEAMQLLTVLADGHRLDPEVNCRLGWALYESGRVDSARQILQQASQMLGPQSTTVRSLAWLAVAMEESLMATRLFSRALEIQPDDHELWRALSQISLNLGNKTLAEHAATEAIRLDPESCSSYLALGWANYAQDNYVAAGEAFDMAMTLCPSDSVVSFETGRFHFRAGRPRDAVPFLEQAIGGGSCPLKWLLLLARVQQASGNRDEARQTLRVASHRYRADYRPFLALAKLEKAAGNEEQARELAESARALAPLQPKIHRLLANLGRSEQG